jgi:hypothetical protein
MFSFAKTFTLLALTTFTLLPATGGCSEIGEAIDCDQMCNKMKDCVDDDLDVHDCAERCEDKVDDNALANQLDACTDCLDRGVSCKEVADECSVCDDVQIALTP